MRANPPPKLPALTSLRFFAAAAIVVHHSRGLFGLPADPTAGGRVPLYLGVSFFFVLSGFILSHVYPALPTAADRGRFLLARFARVWPCHVFAVLLCVLAGQVRFEVIAAEGLWLPLAANVGLVHAWIPLDRYGSSCGVGNGVSWSVSTEFAFYFLFPLLVAGFARTWHVKLVLAGLLAAGLVALADRNGYPVYGADGPTTDALLYKHPLARVYEFVLGMAANRAVRWVAPRVRLGRAAGTVLELAALAALGLNLYHAHAAAGWAVGRLGLAPATAIWFDTGGVTCLGFAVLIGVMALGAGWVSRLLSWSGFVLLGEVSYAVYMLHFILLEYLRAHPQPFVGVSDRAMLVGFWVVLLALSHATWVLVEGPARRFLVGLWPTPTVADAPARRWRLPTLAPTRAGFVLGLELVAVGLVVYACERRPYRVLPEAAAAGLRERSLPGSRDVRFGDRFVLRGVVCEPTHKGLWVELVWESCRPQPLDAVVSVWLSDGGDRAMGGAHYAQDARRRGVGTGTVWKEAVLIPLDRVMYARHFGLNNLVVRLEAADALAPDRGPTDPTRRALLVDLHPPAGAAAVPRPEPTPPAQ